MKSITIFYIIIFLFSPSLIFASDVSGVAGFMFILSIASIVVVIALIVAVFNISSNTKLINQKMGKIIEWMEYFSKMQQTGK